MNKINFLALKSKLPIIIGGIVLICLVLFLSFKIFGHKKAVETKPEPKKKTKVEEINIIPVEERPYLYLTPLADGKNVEITLVYVKKSSQEAEYELEYQAGTLLQGAFGALKLTQLPFTEKILFGSCSAGGACTYHTDIKGGSLLTRFMDGTDKYVLKSDWRYFDNIDKSNKLASKDAKFQLVADALTKQRYAIIFNAPGFPQELEGAVASDIYSLQTSSPLSGKGETTIRANQEGANLQIATWNGQEWQYHSGVIDGKTITAEVELSELYVVVAK